MTINSKSLISFSTLKSFIKVPVWDCQLKWKSTQQIYTSNLVETFIFCPVTMKMTKLNCLSFDLTGFNLHWLIKLFRCFPSSHYISIRKWSHNRLNGDQMINSEDNMSSMLIVVIIMSFFSSWRTWFTTTAWSTPKLSSATSILPSWRTD